MELESLSKKHTCDRLRVGRGVIRTIKFLESKIQHLRVRGSKKPTLSHKESNPSLFGSQEMIYTFLERMGSKSRKLRNEAASLRDKQMSSS